MNQVLEPMTVTFGKHAGMSAGALLLNEPKYVCKWVFEKANPSGPLVPLKDHLQRLVRKFDSKPFTAACHGLCTRPATRGVARDKMLALTWWCSRCEPFERDIERGFVRNVNGCRGVLDHAADHTQDAKLWRRSLRELGSAKGLANRVDDVAVLEFFYDS